MKTETSRSGAGRGEDNQLSQSICSLSSALKKWGKWFVNHQSHVELHLLLAKRTSTAASKVEGRWCNCRIMTPSALLPFDETVIESPSAVWWGESTCLSINWRAARGDSTALSLYNQNSKMRKQREVLFPVSLVRCKKWLKHFSVRSWERYSCPDWRCRGAFCLTVGEPLSEDPEKGIYRLP